MRTMKITKVDRTLLEEARTAFRPTRIRPGVTQDTVMYDAGAAAVLEWLDDQISRRSSETTVTGVQDETVLPDSDEGFMRRLLRGAT